MDLLVKSYHQLSAIGSAMVLNGLKFELSSFMNFLGSLRINSVGYIYISISICESCAQHTILFNTVGQKCLTFLAKGPHAIYE